MAEVTLLLEAEDCSSLPEPYAALSEVAVTRRVYRSGDSEYLLNRIPCRLKDITEFFMAAQIHSRGYALIEQGRIEEIIQAKPHELRTMVEEAAGLSLFKGRREMSERKLERVKENLARVDDVLSEIERQLNFARRQAKKAEAYKTDSRRAFGTGTAGGGPPADRAPRETWPRSPHASSNCARIPRRRAAKSKLRRLEPRKRARRWRSRAMSWRPRAASWTIYAPRSRSARGRAGSSNGGSALSHNWSRT